MRIITFAAAALAVVSLIGLSATSASAGGRGGGDCNGIANCNKTKVNKNNQRQGQGQLQGQAQGQLQGQAQGQKTNTRLSVNVRGDDVRPPAYAPNVSLTSSNCIGSNGASVGALGIASIGIGWTKEHVSCLKNEIAKTLFAMGKPKEAFALLRSISFVNSAVGGPRQTSAVPTGSQTKTGKQLSKASFLRRVGGTTQVASLSCGSPAGYKIWNANNGQPSGSAGSCIQ